MMDTATEMQEAGWPDRAVAWRGVAIFLLLAFGLSWVVQIGVALAVRGRLGGLATLGAGLLLVAVALMWPPALGAFVARRWAEGGDFADAGLRAPSWRWLVLAWFAPAGLVLLAMLASLPLFPFDPTFAYIRGLAAQSGQALPPPALLVAIQLLAGLTVAVPLNGLFAFGEEFGWRGYLLPRLLALLGPWRGVALHGAIWGLWHAPLILLLGYNYPGHPLLGVPFFVVTCTLLGALFAWLRLASGSVFVPTVAHGALNAIAGLPFLLLRDVDPARGGTFQSPIGWLVMLAAIGALAAAGRWRVLRADPRRRPDTAA